MVNIRKHLGVRVYEEFMARPLADIPGGPGNPKKASSILHSAFWSGFNGTPYFRGERGSFCDAAWMAGRDRAKKERGEREEVVYCQGS